MDHGLTYIVVMLRDLKNQKFGRLFVINLSHITNNGAYWKVICDCGKEKIVLGRSMTFGNTKSCGCLNDEVRRSPKSHGKTKTRIYRIWHHMKNRVINKREGYEFISISNEWLIFENFYNDMYDSYIDHVNQYGEKNTTIDRIDGTKGYYKNNCRWATYAVQNRNLSDNHLITYNGETKCLVDWAKEVGIKYNTIIERLDRGWSVEDSLTIPPRYRRA